MNKVDLVPAAESDHLEHLISLINPAATIHRTIRGEIDLGLIIAIDAYSTERTSSRTSLAKSLIVDDLVCKEDCKEGSHAHHLGPHHYELRGISSLQVSCPPLNPMHLKDLDVWVRTVLWENRLPNQTDEHTGGIEVLRCKGIFTSDSGELYVLQGVRNMYEISKVEGDQSNVGLPDEGKLVLIGKGLDQMVRRSLVDILNAKTRA